jgi:hypothetical protein
MKNIAFLFIVLSISMALSAQTNPITITVPNGGEVWETGTTQTITWTTNLTTGYVSIQLRNATATTIVHSIAASVPVTQGSYSWLIPTSIPTSSAYIIRITLVSNTTPVTTVFDESDGVFTITQGTVITPSITVVSPNGGEHWQTGSTYPITWNYTNLTGNVRIELLSPLANPLPTVIAAEVPVENGVFHWTIPSTVMPGSFYQIAITWVSMLTVYIGDVSDAPFTIGASDLPATLTVTSPNGGENWYKGTNHPITWTSSNLPGNVQISLVSSNSTTASAYIIARSVPNTGLFNWSIPLNIPSGTGYRILIRSLDQPGVYDLSDGNFVLLEPFSTRLRVISPNGGEVWHQGETHVIRWVSISNAITPGVEIALIRGGAVSNVPYIITMNAPNTGFYNWTIPNTIPGARNYKIRIRLLNSNNYDQSDGFFAILSPPIILSVIESAPGSGVSVKLLTADTQTLSVSVYNLKGQFIRKLESEMNSGGELHFYWNGEDPQGRQMNKGIYLLRINSGSEKLTRKILLR